MFEIVTRRIVQIKIHSSELACHKHKKAVQKSNFRAG